MPLALNAWRSNRPDQGTITERNQCLPLPLGGGLPQHALELANQGFAVALNDQGLGHGNPTLRSLTSRMGRLGQRSQPASLEVGQNQPGAGHDFSGWINQFDQEVIGGV